MRIQMQRKWDYRKLLGVLIGLTLIAAACSDSGDSNLGAGPPTSIDPAEAQATTQAPSTAPEPAAVEETTTPAPTSEAPEVVEQEPVTFRENRLSTIDADLDGALLGIATGLSSAERPPRFRQLEADAGRQIDIGHVFHRWDLAIPTSDDLFHIEEGRTLMISWNGTDTIEIQNGQHDDWIAQQASAVRDLGEPVLMRWLWEMDGRRRIEWVHSPEDFVGAWLHVRSIFDEVGATNAEFVWCPNEHLFWAGGGDPDAWYPGDDHVDWLCADGYNWEDDTAAPGWIAFDDIFRDFVEWAAPRNKPIMIGETGSNEALTDPAAKGEWFRALPEILRTDLPEVDAVVYFDVDFRTNGDPDWRVDTTPDSYAGFLEFARDPWLNP